MCRLCEGDHGFHINQGIHYGYPTCCIRAFLHRLSMGEAELEADNAAYHDHAPWYGTGYIPCSVCREAAAIDFDKFVAERIAPRRLEGVPFPNGR